jgi:Raf kinase inhibitor-like YbhB/YbcL family protein
MQIKASALVIALCAAASPACAAMTLTSSDIKDGATIAADQIYPRCGGKNISPQLSWSGAPAGTKSFVLTMIDIDVKPAQWSHWIVVDLAPDTASLQRGIASLPVPAKAITSNFGDAAYAGPCPPTGSGLHHYKFAIWALPTPSFAISPDAKATEVSASLTKAALDAASLTGSVSR